MIAYPYILSIPITFIPSTIGHRLISLLSDFNFIILKKKRTPSCVRGSLPRTRETKGSTKNQGYKLPRSLKITCDGGRRRSEGQRTRCGRGRHSSCRATDLNPTP